MNNSSWSVAKRLIKYILGTYKIQTIIVVITVIISSLSYLVGPLFIMYIIDDIATPLIGNQNSDLSQLFKTVVLMGTLYYTGVLASYVSNRLMVNVGQGVLKRIRDELFEHMQTLPINYFDKHTHGDLMSLYTNDVDTLRQMITQSLPDVFSSFVTIISAFSAMLILNVPLSILAVVMVVIMVFTAKKITSKSGKYFVMQQRDIAHVNGFIEEYMNGQKVVKVFNHEKSTIENFEELNDKLCHRSTNANRYSNIMMPVVNNIGFLQYVLTAFLGSILVITGKGAVTVGVIASFLQLTRSFSMPFGRMSNQANFIIMALAGANRIFAVMDETPEVDEGKVTLVRAKIKNGEIEETKERTGTWAWKLEKENIQRYVELKGDVRFKDVVFSYDGKKTILNNISLFAKPGQKIAFVGSTGAGKTTITNLINRFYDIQEGEILYDGINIKDIKKYDLRRSLGMVLQDTNLFTGTIMDNIRYGRLDATDEEVIMAAKLANADSFIKLLPEGYDTLLTNNGEELSQGQKQLLSIARAAVADPPVLILDEATSSIDTRTEALVQAGMDSLMIGRTVFVIAHRLSTIRNSNAIMVLDHGNIIERGDHKDLIKEHGTYYQLYTGALELE
ncbi:ABC transporter ATP-binding protein [Miniphocaeibacter massiliensis]|uniref:ABC transporter ATP-binding protein n=1 Tax=Miniphocaeibacter massiliensis TaxID=2041841 RepID=UPI000C1BB660|nr:ABC transporter ATP-binding protein [Miniphocaeibacter massiliensis]